MGLAQRTGAVPVRTGPRHAALREARICYDHLAGQLGVRLADALGERGYVELSGEGGAVTDSGMDFFRSFGLELGAGSAARLYCRPCLDWSELRLHIGGTLGAKLAAPDRLIVAAIGDGAYVFTNPTAAHWVASMYDLPVLIIIYNNIQYGAVRRATMSM